MGKNCANTNKGNSSSQIIGCHLPLPFPRPGDPGPSEGIDLSLGLLEVGLCLTCDGESDGETEGALEGARECDLGSLEDWDVGLQMFVSP